VGRVVAVMEAHVSLSCVRHCGPCTWSRELFFLERRISFQERKHITRNHYRSAVL
jgi:hypothetical protein